jgi:hypothetical protein
MVESISLGSSGNRVGSWKDVGVSLGSPLFCKEGGGSPKSPLLCKEGRGEVESLPAYTNHGPPAGPSLWMLLPLLTSPYKGEGKCGSLTKGRNLKGAHTEV